jgi:hypothetical protein
LNQLLILNNESRLVGLTLILEEGRERRPSILKRECGWERKQERDMNNLSYPHDAITGRFTQVSPAVRRYMVMSARSNLPNSLGAASLKNVTPMIESAPRKSDADFMCGEDCWDSDVPVFRSPTSSL